MARNTKTIEISHLAAYAEDPRSYCYYKGKPRSFHTKETRKKPRWFPLRSNISLTLSLASFLLFLLSGACLWILLG